MKAHALIRSIYLYVATLIGLIMMIIALYNLVTLGLKVAIFHQADQSYPYAMPACAPVPADPEISASPMPVKSLPNCVSSVDQTQQDTQRTADHQRTAVNSIAGLIIGLPLYWYHWQLIKRDQQTS